MTIFAQKLPLLGVSICLVLLIIMAMLDKFNILFLDIFPPFKVRITYPNKNVNFAYKLSYSQKL